LWNAVRMPGNVKPGSSLIAFGRTMRETDRLIPPDCPGREKVIPPNVVLDP